MSYSSSGYNTNTSSTTDTSSTTTTTVTSTAVSNVTQTSASTNDSLLPTDASIGDRIVIDEVTWEFSSTGWSVIIDGPVLRFPPNPEPKDRYSIGNKTWQYDGSKWVLVYVGAVEDQDDYVKKTDVEHFEYFGVVDNEVTTSHGLYGEEIDNMLTMLNKGPSVYSTAGSPLVVKTGRQQLVGDSAGVDGTNFQSVNLTLNLKTITALSEIDISDLTINGKDVPVMLEPTTYTAVLNGRPNNQTGWTWAVEQKLIDGSYSLVLPSQAKVLLPNDRSFVQIVFKEVGEFRIRSTAQLRRTDSLGNVVVDGEVTNTLIVNATDVLPDAGDSPNPRTISNFLNPERAEAAGGYLFYRTESLFLDDSGATPNVPIINFNSKLNNGLHFVFNSIDDSTEVTRNGFVMVHEDLMNDRLKIEQWPVNQDLPRYDIKNFHDFVIGEPHDATNGISYGEMKGALYNEGDTDALQTFPGSSAYNYKGLSILDPFRPSNNYAELTQGENVSVNSYPLGWAEQGATGANIQYVKSGVNNLAEALTTDPEDAAKLNFDVIVNSFSENTIPNGVQVNRFTRGYLQSVTEVIEDENGVSTPFTTIQFFKDTGSKYFIANAIGTKPALFQKIYVYDLWISTDMNLSLSASGSYETGVVIEPAHLNYVPSGT